MTNHDDESIALNENFQLSLELLAELSGLPQQDLQLLIDDGALVPSQIAEKAVIGTLNFNSHYLISIRKLYRLKQDFELDTNSLGLTLIFLERVRILELQLHHLTSHVIDQMHDHAD